MLMVMMHVLFVVMLSAGSDSGNIESSKANEDSCEPDAAAGGGNIGSSNSNVDSGWPTAATGGRDSG